MTSSAVQTTSLIQRTRTPSTASVNFTFTELYWVPKIYYHHISDLKTKPYELNFFQRVFLTFEFPNTSPISDVVSYLNAIVIVISVVTIIISSLQSFTYQPKTCILPVCNNDPDLCPGSIICAPEILPIFGKIDFACVIFFTVDFIVRISLCGFMPTRLSGTISEDWDDIEKERAREEERDPEDEPNYSFQYQFFRYFASFFTAVDLISILPTYIELAGGQKTGKGLSSLRILRLLRAVRVMKISIRGRMMVSLLSRTMKSSQEAFMILLFYLSLVVIFFASVVYAAESGTFTVSEAYPGGAYIRPDGLGGVTTTPFLSIPTSMYYMIVTLTTVGYGDMTPTTITGRSLACLCCILGVLSLSLPISVISNNFTIEYQRYLDKKAQYESIQRAKKMKMKRALENNRKKRQESSMYFNKLAAETSFNESFMESSLSLNKPLDLEGFLEEEIVRQDESGSENVETNDTSHLSSNVDSTVQIENYALTALRRRSLTPSNGHPTAVDRILAIPDDEINSLNVDDLQALFYELRTACQELHDHNLKVVSMASTLEGFAKKLQRKSVFVPTVVDDGDNDGNNDVDVSRRTPRYSASTHHQVTM